MWPAGAGGPCRSRPPTGSSLLIAVGPWGLHTCISRAALLDATAPHEHQPGDALGRAARRQRELLAATAAASATFSSRTAEALTGHRHRVEWRPSKLRVHQAL